MFEWEQCTTTLGVCFKIDLTDILLRTEVRKSFITRKVPIDGLAF